MNKSIPCSVMRGGTSKGIYFLERDLPPAGEERDQALLRIMGSPDLGQIDGLGGSRSVTSKVAIVAPSQRDGIDVDYTFAQVSVDKPVVSYAGNCGNISSGVGPFAIESGMVTPESDCTTVRIFNTNTEKLMVEQVQTPGGRVTYEGDFAIAGVPGTAAPIKIMVLEPAGTVFPSLLPTGNPVDQLEIPGFGPLKVSIVDVSNPLVFVHAKDIGLGGTELPSDLDQNPDTLAFLESIRGEAARHLGLVESADQAAVKTPGVPKLTIVSEPAPYRTTSGEEIGQEQIDLCSRMLSMQKAHPTYAMTGAMCTAAAAVIPGTVVHAVKGPGAAAERLRIGHPGGLLEAGVDHEEGDEGIHILCAYGYRTARLLLKGEAYC